jgi:hypothetical protein
MRRYALLLAFAVTIPALPLACGGDKKPANTGTLPPPPTLTDAGATSTTATPPGPADAGASSATANAAADAGPLAAILTTDPNQLSTLLAAAAAAGTATLQTAPVANDPIEAGIKANAAKHAKGMQPDGPMARGDLKEGDHLTFLVNLQAGKCYAIVGFAPKGAVHDLDLRLLAPPLYNMLSGEDTTDDNAPIVGKDPNPMCPIIPVPLAYKVDIHAQKGAGKVGVQLYSKNAK